MDPDAGSRLLEAMGDDSWAVLAVAISCSTWDKVSIFESLLNSVACGVVLVERVTAVWVSLLSRWASLHCVAYTHSWVLKLA